MSRHYSISKIKEALQATRGNQTSATQLIIARAMQDPQLLNELVRPHMTGIVAHAVNRVASGKEKPEAVQPEKTKANTNTNKKGKENFGLDLLKTIADGENAEFGQEAYARPVAKKTASQSHIDAIQQIIKKSQNKE